MKPYSHIIKLFLLFLLSLEPVFGQQQELTRIATNWENASVEELRSEENRPFLQEMKRRLQLMSESEFTSSSYLGLLIKVGDDEILQRIAFLKEGIRDGRMLKNSKQPKLIALLGDDLESSNDLKSKVDGDIMFLSKPVFAADVIRSLILSCSAFSPEVKAWASTIHERPHSMYKHPNDMVALRLWWNENKELLLAGQYPLVKPPSKPAPSSAKP